MNSFNHEEWLESKADKLRRRRLKHTANDVLSMYPLAIGREQPILSKDRFTKEKINEINAILYPKKKKTR